MAYATGSATSPSNLLDSIRVFLLAQGWTINYWGADNLTAITAPYRADKALCVMSPAGGYYHYLAYDSTGDIYTSGATGYSGGADRNSQAGHSSIPYNETSTTVRRTNGWACTRAIAGPYAAYYFFASDYYMHVALEVVTNRFVHFHIGEIEKAGSFVGGNYFTGTQWETGYYWTTNQSHQNDPDHTYNGFPFDSSYSGGYMPVSYPSIRIDVDGSTNNWVRFYAGQPTQYAQGCFRSNSLVGKLMERSPNTLNGLSPLIPSIITGPRPLGGASIYGTVRDLHPINIKNLQPKQVMTIGTDDWMVFPIIQKGTGTEFEAVSGNYGIAYLKES